MGPGTVKITFSFPEWQTGKVVPATYDIPVAEPKRSGKMGASSWHYFTAYHPDPATALRRLREEVFAAGQYEDPRASPGEHIRRLYERLGLGADSPECREAVEEVTRTQRYLDTGSEEDLRAIGRARRASARQARH